MDIFFKIPYFNWERYIEAYEKQISIVAEACYGGILCHNLGLQFNSPFVNVRIGLETNDYMKMIKKLDKYMMQTPSTKANNRYANVDWNGMEGRIDYPKLCSKLSMIKKLG